MMSGMFSTIGTAIKRLVGSESDPIDKLDVVGKFELLESTLQNLSAAYKREDVNAAFTGALTSPTNNDFKAVYASYLRISGSQAVAMERQAPMSSIGKALDKVVADCADILSKMSTFGAADSSTTEVTSLKLSDAALLGFYDQAFTLSRWASFMLNIATNVGTDTKTPPFMLAWCVTNASRVESFVRATLNRSATFMGALDTLRRSGKDVALQTDGVTLDQYARDSDYDNVISTAVAGFIPSPFMMVGKYRIEKERAQIESLKASKNWLIAKLGLMAIDMAKIDHDSPEYRRQEKILANYQLSLATTDKELAKYA